MRLVEQPPPLVPHKKYPVHTELPHLKYVMHKGGSIACVCVCYCFKCQTEPSFFCRVYALKCHATGKPGPAEKSGIRVNDIIVAIDNTEGINSTEQAHVIWCLGRLINCAKYDSTVRSAHLHVPTRRCQG